MVFTRSRIQWVAIVRKPPTEHYPENWGMTGRVANCDYYVHIYGWHKHWMWTIRSQSGMHNLIVGNSSHKTIKEAKTEACKWAIVQFIRKIDPQFLTKENYHGYNTLCWFESF